MAVTKPRKRTAVKEAQGTLQKCRTNENEPEPSSSPMCPPGYLSDDAQNNFMYLVREMEEIGIASSTFNAVVAEAAALMEIIANCNIYLQAYYQKEKCYSYTTSNSFGDKIHKPLPEVGIKLAATGKLKGYLSLIGISPSDISRVHAKKKEPEKKGKWAL